MSKSRITPKPIGYRLVEVDKTIEFYKSKDVAIIECAYRNKHRLWSDKFEVKPVYDSPYVAWGIRTSTDASAALRMVRDAIQELFGPIASVSSEEAVTCVEHGPELHHEAMALVEALKRVADHIKPEPHHMRDVVIDGTVHAWMNFANLYGGHGTIVFDSLSQFDDEYIKQTVIEHKEKLVKQVKDTTDRLTPFEQQRKREHKAKVRRRGKRTRD